MRNITAYTLFSSSSGNCLYVKTPDAEILIDAGVSARAVEKSLLTIGSSLSNIRAIFVTHEHVDHVKGLEVISKKHHIPTHMVSASARAMIRDPESSLLRDLYLHPPVYSVRLGETVISSFPTPHDSAASVGYTVEYEGEKFGLATDIGHITSEIATALTGADAVVLESNHDVDMLMHGPYPRELKLRVASKRGHLSNAECAEFASELAQSGTEAFMLAHLSKENNEPTLALDEIRGAVEEYGAYVCVARPDEPVRLIIDFCEEHNDKREVYNPWNA